MPESCQPPTELIEPAPAIGHERLALAERQFIQNVGVDVVADVEIGGAAEAPIVIRVQHDAAGRTAAGLRAAAVVIEWDSV